MTRSLGPNLAGSWYPATAETLRADIRRMLAEEEPDTATEPVVALIQPHAGYTYSGQVAAAGFRQVQGRRFERVILIGPSHHETMEGAAVPDATGYVTPMGQVPLDTAALQVLKGEAGFLSTNRPFDKEHCIEIQLPFLQEALQPGWKLLPVLLGHDLPSDLAGRIAGALNRRSGPGTLVIASSDFTHYGRSFRYVPFEDDLPEKLRDLDMGAVGRIIAGDREGFRSYVTRTGATICGRNAIDILMRMVPGDARAELLRYNTSGNMTSDWRHSVSYAALSFRTADGGPAHEEPGDDDALRSGERDWLLNLARESIRSSLDQQEPPAAPPEDSPPIFRAERATFVTLKVPDRGGYRLRGCIGNMEPYRPLYRSVFENARKAAFSDPRFDPLERQELDRARIEISVLTPMRPVDDPSEIVPGRDGVQLSSSGRTAVFLPQVAEEQGWDRIALLENLCRKAGLHRTAWKKAELSVFQAIVFGEPRNDGIA